MRLNKDDLLLIKGKQTEPLKNTAFAKTITDNYDIGNRQCPKKIWNKYGKGREYNEDLQCKNLYRIMHAKQIADLDLKERIHEANLDHWIEAERFC